MAVTPQFIISDLGLAVASVASPTGPWIDLASFSVGSAVGYTVERNHTALNGNMLYKGNISAYAYLGNNTLNLICRIPPDAGPFDFGEIALYLKDGTMFAKAAFDNLQSKYSSLGTDLALTYTFNCLIKLEQSVAVFQIISETGVSANMVQVAKWTDVVPPELSADPNVQSLLVKEPTNRGDATLLIQSNEQKWTPAGTYYYLNQYILSNASSTWMEIPVSEWPFLNGDGTPSAVELTSMVIETSDGFFRSVASIQHIGSPVSSVRFLLNPNPLLNIPVIGDHIVLHINDPSLGGLAARNTGDAWDIDIAGNAATSDYAARAGTTVLAPNYMPLIGGDFSGNLAVKTTRSPWGAQYAAIDFLNNGAVACGPGVGTMLAQNLYNDGAAWRSKGPGIGTLYTVNTNGNHAWYISNSAAAANEAVTLTQTMVFDPSGNLTSISNVTGFSDRRLKDNLEPIQGALAKLCQLTGYTFDRLDVEGRQTGLIAQAVREVLPEAVIETGDDGMLSIAYGNMAGIIVEAIKELKAQINELQYQVHGDK